MMTEIQTLFSSIKSSDERDSAIQLLNALAAYIANGSVKPEEKNKAWDLIELVRTHQRFTDWDQAAVRKLMEVVVSSPSFSQTQRNRIQVCVRTHVAQCTHANNSHAWLKPAGAECQAWRAIG